jgi:hypothetical protein
MQGFLFRLIPPRPDFSSTMSVEEREAMMAHGGYWSGLVGEGRVIAFGPVADPAGQHGIGIVLVDDERAAAAVRDGDPAMRSPFGFRTEILPMLSLVTRDGRHDAPPG